MVFVEVYCAKYLTYEGQKNLFPLRQSVKIIMGKKKSKKFTEKKEKKEKPEKKFEKSPKNENKKQDSKKEEKDKPFKKFDKDAPKPEKRTDSPKKDKKKPEKADSPSETKKPKKAPITIIGPSSQVNNVVQELNKLLADIKSKTLEFKTEFKEAKDFVEAKLLSLRKEIGEINVHPVVKPPYALTVYLIAPTAQLNKFTSEAESFYKLLVTETFSQAPASTLGISKEETEKKYDVKLLTDEKGYLKIYGEKESVVDTISYIMSLRGSKAIFTGQY